MSDRTVLITGGGGYVGTEVVRQVMGEVATRAIVCDPGYIGREYAFKHTDNYKLDSDLKVWTKDIRSLRPTWLRDIDAVIDLASPPRSDRLDDLHWDITYAGRNRIRKFAEQYGVDQYIQASTCSVYGTHDEDEMTEDGPVDPQSSYAKAHRHMEQETIDTDGMTTTVLRLGTVYGYNEPMRLGSVVNKMVWDAVNDKQVKVGKPGDQWRPLAHIRAVGHAFSTILTHDDHDAIDGEIFNIVNENIQIEDLADTVIEAMDHKVDKVWMGDEPDDLSYRASAAKYDNLTLAGMTRSLDMAIERLIDRYASFEPGPRNNRREWYRTLRDTKERFYS